jgi:tRNA A-37 threonylcarbamoyl transferase component Bud32
MERAREVYVGKLAIGRRVLDRADAVRCFHASRGEPFWELAVRQGLLDRAQADDLVRTIDAGSLICRGTCATVFPFDAEGTPLDGRCPQCGGTLYVTSKAAAAARETWKDSGSDELREALAEGRAVPLNKPNGPQVGIAPAAPRPSPAPPPEPREVAETVLPPRRVVALTPQGGDSLPSAIAVPAKNRPAPKVEEKPAASAAPAAFVPFTIGTYDVLGPIGKGGMGAVFRARHRALNQICAIKIFVCHSATDDAQRQRFDQEVRTMAKINHPGVVRVRAGGVVAEDNLYKDRPYYVMEYVEGRDLSAWAREQPRSVGENVAMMVKICEIVAALHDRPNGRPIVHRDLKPQNVLVAKEGDVPKICDFGLAKVEDSKLTRTGDIMGTPQFMPPEQAKGQKNVFTAADVYSLGAILYYLLAGEPPFTHPRLMDLIRMIERDPPPRVTEKNPQVPSTVEAIILKCLEKSPGKRFPFAGDLGKALAALNLPL